MSLRKFTQQSYFSHAKKQQAQPASAVIQLPPQQCEEEDEQPIEVTPKKIEPPPALKDQCVQTPKIEHHAYCATSELFRKVRTKKREISPNFKTDETITQFNQSYLSSTQPRQSRKEQLEVVDRLLMWDKKKTEKVKEIRKQKADKELLTTTGKPQINQHSIKVLEKGLKKYNNLADYVKSLDAAVQTAFHSSQLAKLPKLHENQRVEIVHEYEEDQVQDDEQANKAVQVQLLDIIQSKKMSLAENHLDISGHNQQESQMIPIHIRFQYDLMIREAKIKQMNAALQRQSKEAKDRSRVQSGHTSFKEFLEGQQTFLKKKEKRIQQKYEEKLKTEESTPSFQPQLNKTSRNILKSVEIGKFDERMSNFLQMKEMKIERQKELCTPSFQPKISAKSRRIASNLYSSLQSQMDEYSSLKLFESQR